MREAVRRVELTPGTDYIVTALDDLENQPFEDLRTAIESAISGSAMKSEPPSPDDQR